MPSIRLNDKLDRRLRAFAAAQGRSRSRCAREAIAAFVSAAERDAPREFSYHERLSLMLHTNWQAYPEGHNERVPPELILEMANNGDEALIPTLIEDCGPFSMSGLVLFLRGVKLSARDRRLKEITALLNRLRYRQYYGEAPVFTGIYATGKPTGSPAISGTCIAASTRATKTMMTSSPGFSGTSQNHRSRSITGGHSRWSSRSPT